MPVRVRPRVPIGKKEVDHCTKWCYSKSIITDREGSMLKAIGAITLVGVGLYTGLIQMAIALVGVCLIWIGSVLTLVN